MKYLNIIILSSISISVYASPWYLEQAFLSRIVLSWGPIILLIVVWIYFMKITQGNQKKLQDEYIERTKEYMDNTEKLLEKIVDELKKK